MQLTPEEIQQKISTLKSMDDVAAFMKDIAASAVAKVSGEESDEPAPVIGSRRLSSAIKGAVKAKRYEPAENDLEQNVIALYAKGLTTRDIMLYLKEHHGVEISQSTISGITDKVYPLIKEWQTRPLSPVYPFVYLDGLHFKVRESGKIVPKCAYIVLGITSQGYKEVLGIWIGEVEGAKFWMGVLNEIKNRGVDQILIACVDGLRGFSEAINAIYPDAQIQQCIVHQIRHTVKFLPHKDREPFCNDLREIYSAPTQDAGREALEKVKQKWPRYQPYLKSWEDKWDELSSFYEFPEPIRRSIYTTNAIESLNHQFRKVTKTTTIFPHNDSLEKLLWLAQDDIAKRWSHPVRRWGEVVSQLAVLFPGKIDF
jgi:transposase-like protein